MGARTESKARDAITSIQEQLSSPVDIRHIPLDLASFKSIRAAAERFTSDCDRLDILVLNAGTMGNPPTKTEEGYEVQFGTNHIGHFLFTKLLLSTLRKTAAGSDSSDVRVVSVSSLGHNGSPPFETMTSTSALLESSTWTRYAASKAANILFASELARRYPEILSVSIHPGAVASDLYGHVKDMDAVVKSGVALGSLFFRSVRTGALTQIYAAGARRDLLTNGAYYVPIGIESRSRYTLDKEMAKKLWEWTEAEVEKN